MSSKNKIKYGVIVIKEYLSLMPNKSGIYQMFNNDKCLYIGKAKNLKKRVLNYANLSKNLPRIQKMISETIRMHHIVTKTEEEALLLEADLIKNLKPKYNILLRDDKTFPYIEIDLLHKFPRIRKVKTKEITKPNLYGPFANSQLVDDVISLIQKIFKIRVCSDNNFKNRTKPCIYYQIKRCSAPCVNKISFYDYKENINSAINLIKGKSKELKQHLATLMIKSSDKNEFEKAITYREQIKMLNQISTTQSVILPEPQMADFIAILKQKETYCVQVFSFKLGRSNGCLSYFPKNIDGLEISNILASFIMQFYNNHPIPDKIYCNVLPEDHKLIIKALKSIKKHPVKIILAQKNFIPIMDFVVNNTFIMLEKQIGIDQLWAQEFYNLSKLLKIDSIKRIEIYDNSHFKGSSMLGVMVCAKVNGFNKNEYRIFKLKNKKINKEDDYGMLKEALTRRLSKLNKNNTENQPSLLIIDGGTKQLKVTLDILKKLNLDNIKAISVVKGENRKYGAEKIILENMQTLDLTEHYNTFKFILKLRDEAHRFAITSQRKSNLKQVTSSILDQIEGIGEKRKAILLNYFGSVENLKKASLTEISNIAKISTPQAKKILEWLN